MPLPHTDWTVEMLDALPDDGNRYEVIDGALFVTPAPTNVHQRAVAQLVALLLPVAARLGLDLLPAPAAVRFSRRREVQPDVLVIPRLPDGRFAKWFEDVSVLLLAAEVLSPTTRRTDRTVKRDLYQDEHVRDYWLVDTDARTFERWGPTSVHSETFADTLLWQPLEAQAPFVLDVAQYFRDVLGE